MPIPQDLLDILVCPVCKTPVAYTPDQSSLKCQTCRRIYPIKDEIPVMLPEEATIEAASQTTVAPE
jgi:LSD1 subclass zinc finger protein